MGKFLHCACNVSAFRDFTDRDKQKTTFKKQKQDEKDEIMGISRSYVSRIEKKAIGKLTNEISKS